MLSLLYGPTLTSVHDYWENHRFDNVHFLYGVCTVPPALPQILWDLKLKGSSHLRVCDRWWGREAQPGNGVGEFVHVCASHGNWGMNHLTEDVLGFERGLKC